MRTTLHLPSQQHLSELKLVSQSQRRGRGAKTEVMSTPAQPVVTENTAVYKYQNHLQNLKLANPPVF